MEFGDGKVVKIPRHYIINASEQSYNVEGFPFSFYEKRDIYGTKIVNGNDLIFVRNGRINTGRVIKNNEKSVSVLCDTSDKIIYVSYTKNTCLVIGDNDTDIIKKIAKVKLMK